VGVVVKKRTKRNKKGQTTASKLEMANKRLSTSLGDLVKMDATTNRLVMDAKDRSKSKSSSQNHLEQQQQFKLTNGKSKVLNEDGSQRWVIE
jgi:hypothetical protein